MRDRILVVDDDALIRDTVGYSLGKEGYQVLSASTGADALAKARLAPLDLAVLDVGLPDMDGFDLCRTCKRSCGCR